MGVEKRGDDRGGRGREGVDRTK